MGCSCGKAKNRGGNMMRSSTIIDRSIPHTIKPGESCAFCAEKHVALAYNSLTTYKLSPTLRQLAIGELECARRHLFVEYNEQAHIVSDVIRALLFRQPIDEVRQLAGKAAEATSSLASSITEGKDTSSVVEYDSFTQPPAGIHPLLGELHFCAAWRLATELGYENINRTIIIGDLTMAQIHIHEHQKTAAMDMRNIRHLIQRSEYKEAVSPWGILAYNMDVYITPNISNIKNTYGEDLDWYLTM